MSMRTKDYTGIREYATSINTFRAIILQCCMHPRSKLLCLVCWKMATPQIKQCINPDFFFFFCEFNKKKKVCVCGSLPIVTDINKEDHVMHTFV